MGQLAFKHQANGVTLEYHYHTQGAQVGLLKDITQQGLIWDSLVVGELNNPNDTSTEKTFTWGNGVSQTTQYDHRGRIQDIRTNEGLQLVYEYDADGNIVSFSRAANDEQYQQTYGYDGAGRLAQIYGGEDSTAYTGHTYDAAGNRLSTTRANLKADTPQTVVERLEQTGSTDKVVDLAIDLYQYEDQSNRLQSVRSGNNTQDNTQDDAYNAQGSPTKIRYTSYEYNSRQRPIKVYQQGTLVAEYAYNAWGERVKKTVYQNNTATTTHYLYENQRLIAETNGQGKIIRQYLYHDQRPIGLWQNGNFFAVHTDHQGTPQTLTDAKQRTVWSASYNPFGRD